MKISFVAVVGFLITCISARPSSLHWKVPCWGSLVMRELLCGVDVFPGPHLAEGRRSGEDSHQSGQRTTHTASQERDNQTRTDSLSRLPSGVGSQGGPSGGYPGNGFNPYGQHFLAVPGLYVQYEADRTLCNVDGYISSASLMYRYGQDSCDGLYEVKDSQLIVYPPCSGHFFIAMCKSEW